MNDGTRLLFEHVSHAYENGPDVVRDVSCGVEPGALTCLLGPSGCGKTTLLRLAAGLEILQRGRIVIGDHTVADADAGIQTPPEKRGIGMMFQDYALFPHLTILENVTFGLDRPTPEHRRWVDDLLERIGLMAYKDSYPHILSGGQQQRVALLRAIAPRPRVLLLDEPFSDLDVTLRAQIREDTLKLLRDLNIASLMVTHDPEEAMYMADRILVMEQGRIVQSGTPEQTYCRPANAYVAALFGPVNRLNGVVAQNHVDTPLGRFDAGHLTDGTRVQIFIRPEGIAVRKCRDMSDSATPDSAAAASGTVMRVLDVNLLGRSSHVHLGGIGTPQSREIHLLARVHGVFVPERGSEVEIAVDTAHAFVFSAE
ncbi:MAG: ABC transporter ATP-binding protein [Rhodospirillales bacterium]